MSHIFISYSRRDLDFAQKIVNALAANNLDTWIDWKSIPKGEDWEQEIYRGIEEADAFLFLISPDSVASQMCNKEVAHAVKNNKRVIPIVIRGADIKNFLNDISRNEISRRNWIFCRDGQDDFSKAIEETQKTIHTDYEWLKYHTKLQVKALDWERLKDNSRLLREKELSEAEEELASAGLQKDPQPTNVQRQYILASRKDEERRRNKLLSISVIAGIIMVALGIYAQFQGNLATQRAATAQAASTGEARQAATAVAERRRAETEAKIALAGEHAALALAKLPTQLDLSYLLSIEAFHELDSRETRGALLDSLQAYPRLRQFLSGHRNTVNSVIFSPDGKILASASSDHTIILWDVASRKPIGQPLIGHTDTVYTVNFSPDGQTLASGSCARKDDSGSCIQGEIILWDLASRKPIGQPLIGHSNFVPSLAFSLDGKALASASCAKNSAAPTFCIQGEIILWDVASHKPIGQPFIEHKDLVRSVIFSPDGKALASGSCARKDDSGSCIQGEIILWDVASRKPIGQPLIGHTDLVQSVVFSPDGKTLASGSLDSTIILWDVASARPIGQPLTGPKESVYTIVFNPDGKILASAGCAERGVFNECLQSEILLWDATSGLSIGQPLLWNKDVHSVAFSPDGKTLASGSADHNIILWDITSDLPIGRLLTGHSEIVLSLAFSPDGKTLVSGSHDNTVILWNVASGQLIRQILTGDRDVYAVAFSPDGKMIASGGNSFSIILWDIASGQPVGNPLTGHNSVVVSLAFSPNGKILAAGILGNRTSGNNPIVLWDLASGQSIGNPLAWHDSPMNSVAFSPDGKILATGSYDGSLRLWNVATRQSLRDPLWGHNSVVSSVAFSPNGQILASGSWDNTIMLWDVASGHPVGQPLIGHTQPVSNIAFSPDGKVLASSSSDHTIILWDVASGQPIGQPLIGHKDIAQGVAFSPDGKILASSSNDSTIIRWDMNPESWIKKTCQRVGRNFTQAEWKQYFPDEEYRLTCPQWPAGQ